MISKVGLKNTVGFGRALSTEELKEYQDVRKKAQEALGPEGKSILIVHDACLPQNPAKNTGTGHIASEESGKFFDLMKAYCGFNMVETLPPGGRHCPYKSAALSLGERQISAELLTKPEYGQILKQEEFDEIVKSNTNEYIVKNVTGKNPENIPLTKENIINFENVVDDNSSTDKALRKAYDRFVESADTKVVELKKEFEAYKVRDNDRLEFRGVFDALRKKHGQYEPKNWSDKTHTKLYDTDVVSLQKRQEIISDLRKDPISAKEIDFTAFKQFLADKHLEQGRKNLNAKGMKLVGDCQISNDTADMWAHPKAFNKNYFVGNPKWEIHTLDYDAINDPNSECAKYLKKKVTFFAQRYDTIRFDVSWAYIAPEYTKKGETESTKKYIGPEALNMIERTVKEVKGDKFDPRELLHEFEGGMVWREDNTIKPELKKFTQVFSAAYMNNENKGWGYTQAYLNRGLDLDDFVIGVANHDHIALQQLAHVPEMSEDVLNQWAEEDKKEGKPMNAAQLKERSEAQIKPLATSLGISEQKLRTDKVEFTNAKFAEPMLARHKMLFYMDIFGRRERFNSQDCNSPINYRYKITDNFESKYHTALQEGRGFNLMDAYSKVFKVKKLDQSHPELYKAIVKFRDILVEKGVTTEKEANELPTQTTSKSADAKSKNKWIIAGVAALALAGGTFAYVSGKDKKQKPDNIATQ